MLGTFCFLFASLVLVSRRRIPASQQSGVMLSKEPGEELVGKTIDLYVYGKTRTERHNPPITKGEFRAFPHPVFNYSVSVTEQQLETFKAVSFR